MCGRFSLTSKIEHVIEQLNIINAIELAPSYNIAPTQDIAVVRLYNERFEISKMRWGLIPFWMKEKPKTNNLINARAETVSSKPSFRNAYTKRRCLIPANGFYEWQKSASGKQPYYIERKDKHVFTFAGLWEHWELGGESIDSCTIITTAANNEMQSIHQRMPVIINSDQYDTWFHAEDPASLLSPYPSGILNLYPVSSHVNSPTHNDERCIEKLS